MTLPQSLIYTRTQELLIKPLDRIKFISRFWLTAVTSQFLLIYLCYWAISLIYTQEHFWTINLAAIIMAIILGLSIGAVNGIIQYNWLRQYFSREWIIANAVNYGFMAMSIVFIFLREFSIQGNVYGINQTTLITLVTYSLVVQFLAILSLVIQGYSQRLVFQSYIKNIKWWLWFPLVANLVSRWEYFPIALIIWLFSRKKITNLKSLFVYLFILKGVCLFIYLPLKIPGILPFNNKFFALVATLNNMINYLLVYKDANNISYDLEPWFSWGVNISILVAIQAIAICYFHKRSQDESLYLNSESLLISTPDLQQYSQVRSIIKHLGQKINQIWQTDLNTSFTLIYWLGVQPNGEIVACHPLNQVSQDFFSATPLAQLVREPAQTAKAKATAKLQISFNDPGIFEIKSLAGIPLHLITIGSIAIIIVFSVATRYLIFLIISQFT